MSFVFETAAAFKVRRTSASNRGSSSAFTPSAQKSRPIRPAIRPVNALTHERGRLPCHDLAARISLHKPGSIIREEVHHG
jgi:hypothetical protein